MSDTKPVSRSFHLTVGGKPIVIDIVNKSLLDTDVDAIVNAANTAMRGGGGIDGAIHAKAGHKLLDALTDTAPRGCPTGEVVVTPGFDTGFQYIFHTPGPQWKGGNQDEHELLENCYWNCMNEANIRDVPSIGFCSISTGIYGYPLEPAAKIAVNTVLNYLKSVSEEVGVLRTNRIVFAMFTESEYQAYLSALENAVEKHTAPAKTARGNRLWYRILQWINR